MNLFGKIKGAFGSSRGQKFTRLAEPIGMMLDTLMLYNLRRDIPGHPKGSSVARATVETNL